MFTKKQLSAGLLAASLLTGGLFATAVYADDAGDAASAQHTRPAATYHLIPRFAEEKLDLTDDQKGQIADLEKETKEKLAKILTTDQMKILNTARPPHPGQGGQNNQGGGDQGGAGGPPPNN